MVITKTEVSKEVAFDIKLAEFVGWTHMEAYKCERCYNDRIWANKPGSSWGNKHWRSPMGHMNNGSDHCFTNPPDYHSDIYDIRRDLEKPLREAGWVSSHHEEKKRIYWVWTHPKGGTLTASDKSEAYARAKAAGLALKAMQKLRFPEW